MDQHGSDRRYDPSEFEAGRPYGSDLPYGRTLGEHGFPSEDQLQTQQMPHMYSDNQSEGPTPHFGYPQHGGGQEFGTQAFGAPVQPFAQPYGQPYLHGQPPMYGAHPMYFQPPMHGAQPMYAPQPVFVPQPGQQTVVVNGAGVGKRVNHLLHLVLTVLTGGLWLPVWLILALAKS